MSFLGFSLGGSKHDWVVSMGSETIWYAVGPKGDVLSSPACALVDTRRNRMTATGDTLEKLQPLETDTLKVVRLARFGGFSDAAIAGQVLADLYRKAKGTRWLLAPRVIAVCPDLAKPSVKQAALGGARAVITMPPPMAAALGAGLPISQLQYHSVIVLDRDWCAYMLISQNQAVASFEFAGGIDDLLQDIAIFALATRGVVVDPDSAHQMLCRDGLAGTDTPEWDGWLKPLEAGSNQQEPLTETDLRRSALPFMYRLRWHHKRAIAKLDAVKQRDAAAVPLNLFGPYARLPGMADLLARSFETRVDVPPSPEKAIVRGGQKVLADLDALLRGVPPRMA